MHVVFRLVGGCIPLIHPQNPPLAEGVGKLNFSKDFRILAILFFKGLHKRAKCNLNGVKKAIFFKNKTTEKGWRRELRPPDPRPLYILVASICSARRLD